MPARRMAAVAGLAGLVLAAGCGVGGGGGVGAPATGAGGPSGDLSGPLTALPACADAPAAIDDAPAEGIVLPDGGVLLEQRPVGPVVNAAGYVALTPIAVRLRYEELDRDDDVEVLSSEDEVFEAELLLQVGERRLFVRATAACDRGSNLLLVSAPAGDEAAVPSPRGDGSVTTD